MPNATIHSILWVILLLPLLTGLLSLLMGHWATRWVGWVAAGVTLAGLCLSSWITLTTDKQSFTFFTDWIVLPGRQVPFIFRLDRLTQLMLLIVHVIAFLVQVYSISYLHKEPDRHRYVGFLSLFIGSMLGIILSGNLLILYFFWELVGLSSYLLIGFWYRNPKAAMAAKKAFLMNRIGDTGLLVGIFLTIYQFGTSDLAYLANSAPLSTPLATLTGLCLFCGCMGKSAQFPLSTWLPDAMEGPTPVSALIHAATMVAAGIFLVARIHFLLTPDARFVIVIIGLTTSLLGAYSALFQSDIKKLLAHSTISQLGLMVVALGTGNVSAALFHLTTHAFFKAGLFLAAGSVIHGSHTQDMYQMGGLRTKMPLTFIGYTVCAAALAGVPLFSGFLSKETILISAFSWARQQPIELGYLIPSLVLLSSGLTACYLMRQLRLVFLGTRRNPELTVHESDSLLIGPVLILAALSIGFVFSKNPFSPESAWFFQLFPTMEPQRDNHSWVALVSITTITVGLFTGYQLRDSDRLTRLVRWSQANLYLDDLYDSLIVRPFVHFAYQLHLFDRRVIDPLIDGLGKGIVVLAHVISWIDQFLVDGLVDGGAWLARCFGGLTRSVQSGRVQSYIVSAVIGLLLVLWLLN